MHLAANEKDKKYFKSPPWTQTFCVSPLCTEFKSLRVSAFLCELHAGRGGMQICDTTCHAMITRKHVAMETAITIVRRHISVAFLEQSRQQIVTNLEPDHYTETRSGKLWRYKCLIHISRHRVSCLSFRWESCKFLYLLAVVTIDRTDWSQNPLRLINPLSVFFIFLLRNSKYHSRFSSYDLVFGYERCQPWPLYLCMAISLSLLSQMAPSWSLVLASCLQERYPRETSLDGSIRREWSFIA